MRITKKEMIESEKEIGYECDICHKKIMYESALYHENNTIIWSHPSGGWGERTETERIDFCSWECFCKALKNVYFGADIKLSYDF